MPDTQDNLEHTQLDTQNNYNYHISIIVEGGGVVNFENCNINSGGFGDTDPDDDPTLMKDEKK